MYVYGRMGKEIWCEDKQPQGTKAITKMLLLPVARNFPIA